MTLCEAAELGILDEMRVLIDAGADLEQRGSEGATPLLKAAGGNNTKAVALLLNRGADIDAKMDGNGSVLHVATNANVLLMLLMAGANTDARDNRGQSVLHWGLWKPERIDILLDWGVNIEAMDDDGYTPAWRAMEEGMDAGYLTLVLRGSSVEPMRAGTLGRSIYPTNWDMLVRLGKSMALHVGVGKILRRQRPDVYAAIEALLNADPQAATVCRRS